MKVFVAVICTIHNLHFIADVEELGVLGIFPTSELAEKELRSYYKEIYREKKRWWEETMSLDEMVKDLTDGVMEYTYNISEQEFSIEDTNSDLISPEIEKRRLARRNSEL